MWEPNMIHLWDNSVSPLSAFAIEIEVKLNIKLQLKLLKIYPLFPPSSPGRLLSHPWRFLRKHQKHFCFEAVSIAVWHAELVKVGFRWNTATCFLGLLSILFLHLRISAELQTRFLRFACKYWSDPAVIWLAGMKLVITPSQTRLPQPLTVRRWDDHQFYTIVYSCWRSCNCYWHNLSSCSQLRNRHGTGLGWTCTLVVGLSFCDTWQSMWM